MALIVLLVHLPILNSVLNWSVGHLTVGEGNMESELVITGISFVSRKSIITTVLYKTLLPYFIEISVFKGNSIDHDQMLHSTASDLGLHCLPMPLVWDAMLSSLSMGLF